MAHVAGSPLSSDSPYLPAGHGYRDPFDEGGALPFEWYPPPNLMEKHCEQIELLGWINLVRSPPWNPGMSPYLYSENSWHEARLGVIPALTSDPNLNGTRRKMIGSVVVYLDCGDNNSANWTRSQWEFRTMHGNQHQQDGGKCWL